MKVEMSHEDTDKKRVTKAEERMRKEEERDAEDEEGPGASEKQDASEAESLDEEEAATNLERGKSEEINDLIRYPGPMSFKRVRNAQ